MTTIDTQPESICHLVAEGFGLPVLTANFISLSPSNPPSWKANLKRSE
ncbi:hypothetical protein HYE59_10305 [Aggregatibacter actinomycetemcomitans]|nr:hypothetical protein [Aggregatibacter actinomycetemcomitans]MBN6077903.1 hypothetical protein [Aggregatibacter actinomycetemcomitans]